MGWIKGRYYVRKVRKDGRVTSVYIGGGAAGAEAAACDAQQRAERCARAEAQRAHWTRWQALDRLLQHLFDAVEQLLRATLHQAGYHYHRGQWRKRREPRPPQRGEPSGPDPPPGLG